MSLTSSFLALSSKSMLRGSWYKRPPSVLTSANKYDGSTVIPACAAWQEKKVRTYHISAGHIHNTMPHGSKYYKEERPNPQPYERERERGCMYQISP